MFASTASRRIVAAVSRHRLKGFCALTTLCLAACSGTGPSDGAEPEAVASSQQPLAITDPDATNQWFFHSNVVPVCFINGDASLRTTFRQVIEETWKASSGLTFTWKDQCGSNPPADSVPVYFMIGVPDTAFGGEARGGVGNRISGIDLVNRCSLPENTPVKPQLCAAKTINNNMLKSTFAHEMGHVLGFIHEHGRDDSTATCAGREDYSGEHVLSIYDPASIMNYCRDFNSNGVPDGDEGHDDHHLSTLDKLGAAEVYARIGVQLLSATTDGNLFHTIREPGGTWPHGWGNVETAAGQIGTVRDAALQYLKNGASNVVAVNSNGDIWHTTRSKTGVWTSFIDIQTTAAGDPGSVLRVGVGDINDTLHLVVTTNTGGLKHTSRNPSTGVWTAFVDVEAAAGNIGTPVKAGVAGIGTSLHTCAVSSDGRLWHTYRRSNGTWATFADIEAAAGEKGSFVDVDCTNVNNDLHVVGVTTTGAVWHTIRVSETAAFRPFIDVRQAAGTSVFASRVATSQIVGELHVVLKAGTNLVHTRRNGTERATDFTPTWTPAINVQTAVGQGLSAASVGLD